MIQVIANLINGLSFGMVLFLIASGLSLVMGLMGITNLSHGALYMVGAYIGWSVAVKLNLGFWLGMLCGAIGSAAVGFFIERWFLRSLYKKPNEQVLVTYGFVYIITNVVIWIWGARARLAFTAPILKGSFMIGNIPIAKDRLTMIFVGGILALLLWFFQDKTKIGAIVRAGMDDKEMISGLGINTELVFTLVFVLAAFIAGLAGVVGAQMLGPYSSMGIDMLLYALIVVVVGGIGSIQGSLIGGLSIGLVDTFGKAYLPDLAMFTIYFFMILVLLTKPSGLLGRKL